MNMHRNCAAAIVALVIVPLVSVQWGLAAPAPALRGPQSGVIGAPQGPATPAQTKLSLAVTEAASVNSIALINKALTNTATPSDVASARVALATLFAYLEETGMNQKLQAAALAAKADFIENGVSDGQIRAQYSGLEARGMKLPLNQYRNAMMNGAGERQQMIAALQKEGIKGMEQQLLTGLAAAQAQMAAMPAERGPLHLSGWNLTLQPHLRRVVTCANLAAFFGYLAAQYPEFAEFLGTLAALYALEDSFGWC